MTTPSSPKRSTTIIRSFSRCNSSSLHDFQSSDFQDLFDILEHPISCGYLHTFCESEYNSESIRYIIIVDEFKDMMKKDFMNWKIGWREMDTKLKLMNEKMNIHDHENHHGNISSPSSTSPPSPSSSLPSSSSTPTSVWPSTKVIEIDAKTKVQEIFDEFISLTGKSQICLATDVYDRTLQRIKYLNYYGPTVFDESLIDPFRTLKRDILPRFKNSSLYEEMLLREKEINNYLINSNTIIELNPPELPSLSILHHPSYHTKDSYQYSLHDFLSYSELFQYLSIYMKKLFCIENLWCYRMIELYETQASIVSSMRRNSTLTASNNTPELKLRMKLKDMAWEIYRYFVLENSRYEISLYHEHRKKIMLHMADPHRLLFEPIKQSVMQSITSIFQKYILTEEYTKLKQLIRDEMNKSQGNNNSWVSSLWSTVGNGLMYPYRRIQKSFFNPKLLPEDNVSKDQH